MIDGFTRGAKVSEEFAGLPNFYAIDNPGEPKPIEEVKKVGTTEH